jgi:glycopeptide antibiotics resistance protein
MRSALAFWAAVVLALLVPRRAGPDTTWNRWRLRAALALSVALIFAIVLPWQRFQDHTHWQRVQWIPFRSPPITLRDLAGNVALYVPVGYLIVRLTGPPVGIPRAVACAALLSIGTETTQLFSHGRFPSMTDVTCNLAGACLGAAIAWWQRSGGGPRPAR